MTIQQLQLITLERQGLLDASAFGKGKKAVLSALERLGYLQIDSLSVVERAHHHTLWARIPDYKTNYLDELVEERKVFEYWFHAASYLPVKDFRFALPRMLAIKQNKSKYYNHADPKVMEYVMDTIREEGPKRAIDFKSKRKKSGSWWNWKPAKLALERLFMQGDLMICGRKGMQKIYDSTENVLPPNTDLTFPDPIEYAEYLVKTYLQAYGFTTVKQITHLKTGKAIKNNVNRVLASMLEEGLIQEIEMEGLPTVYVQQELLHETFKAKESNLHILSPFDNSIIHRDRVKGLFDFDFRLECYTPKEKRKYGYFCLPLLLGNTFLGRVDCKAHRKEKLLEIIHLHIENQSMDVELWLEPLLKSMKRFATFNGCESVKLTKASPSKWTKTVKQAININKAYLP